MYWVTNWYYFSIFIIFGEELFGGIWVDEAFVEETSSIFCSAG